MPIKIGIRLWSEVGSGIDQVHYAMLAEKYGLDYCWVVNDLTKRSALAVLPAIAANTSKITIGPCILNPYSLHPAEIASYIATLDEISNGRAVLGIGAGAVKILEWAGVRVSKPLTRTKEAIEAVRRLLSGLEAFRGTEIQWSNEIQLRFTPRRRQIPIYLGCAGDKMLKLAGQIADGALPILFPPEHAAHAIPTILEAAEKCGRRDQIEIAGCIWFSISEETEVAEKALRSLIAYYAPHIPLTALSKIGVTPAELSAIEMAFRERGLDAAMEAIPRKMFKIAIYGTPEQCLEQIAVLAKRGITQINIGPPLGPDVKEALRLIGTKLAPAIRELQ